MYLEKIYREADLAQYSMCVLLKLKTPQLETNWPPSFEPLTSGLEPYRATQENPRSHRKATKKKKYTNSKKTEYLGS